MNDTTRTADQLSRLEARQLELGASLEALTDAQEESTLELKLLAAELEVDRARRGVHAATLYLLATAAVIVLGWGHPAGIHLPGTVTTGLLLVLIGLQGLSTPLHAVIERSSTLRKVADAGWWLSLALLLVGLGFLAVATWQAVR